MSSRRHLAVLAALGAFGAAACSVVLDAPKVQCASDRDCTARGPTFAGAVCVQGFCQSPTSARWACLGQPAARPPASGGEVAVTMEFYDSVRTDQAVRGIEVRPCARLDVTCTAPLGAAVASDNDGRATVTVPSGFDGYLEMKGPGVVPGLFFFSPAPTAAATYRIALVTPESFAGLAQAVGASLDPAQGHAFLFALDCARTFGTFADGVSYEAEPVGDATRAFYLRDRLPSTSATTTDPGGVGGFANLPPGVVSLRGRVAATGDATGSVGLLIRAGTISYAPIVPP